MITKEIFVSKNSLTNKYIAKLSVTCDYHFKTIVPFEYLVETDRNGNYFNSLTSANLEGKRIANIMETIFIEEIIRFILNENN